jgi:hypothetical protein
MNIQFMFCFFLPILVLPQFIIGLFLGYIRIKFNMFFAILFHMLHNLIFLSLFFFALQSGENLLDIENDDYRISIDKVLVSQNTSYYSSENLDSVGAKSYQLADLIANLNNIGKIQIIL